MLIWSGIIGCKRCFDKLVKARSRACHENSNVRPQKSWNRGLKIGFLVCLYEREVALFHWKHIIRISKNVAEDKLLQHKRKSPNKLADAKLWLNQRPFRRREQGSWKCTLLLHVRYATFPGTSFMDIYFNASFKSSWTWNALCCGDIQKIKVQKCW